MVGHIITFGVRATRREKSVAIVRQKAAIHMPLRNDYATGGIYSLLISSVMPKLAAWQLGCRWLVARNPVHSLSVRAAANYAQHRPFRSIRA